MRKLQYILLIILIIVGIARFSYEKNIKNDVSNIINNFEKHQKLVILNGGITLSKVRDIEELNNLFEHNLGNCVPMNTVTEDYINYVIYGMKNNKCSFEKYSQMYDLKCDLPLAVARKYASSEDGFDSYLNKVNNDSNYCSYTFFDNNKKQKSNKKKH